MRAAPPTTPHQAFLPHLIRLAHLIRYSFPHSSQSPSTTHTGSPSALPFSKACSLPSLLKCYPDKTCPSCGAKTSIGLYWSRESGAQDTYIERSHFLLWNVANLAPPQQWLLLTGQTRGLGVPRIRSTQQSCSMSFSPGNRGDPFNSSPIMQPTALWIQI